jgi:hypothetical protein
MNAAQTKVFRFFTTFIGHSKPDILRLLLRFITGSAVLPMKIVVLFNGLTGLRRRPIAITCNCVLQLSTSYCSYPEFELEFTRVLTHEWSWFMDAV